MKFKTIIITLAVIVFLIFVLQNTAMLTLSFIVYEITMPRAILLSLTLGLGVIIGVLLPYKFKKDR